MADFIEISDSVDLLTVRVSEGLLTSIVAVHGEEPFIIDTGIPVEGPRAVREYLSFRGIRPPRTLVNTHFHWDHSGGNYELAESGQLSVLAHLAEGALIAQPSRFTQAMTAVIDPAAAPPAARGVEPTVVLDGARIGESGWEVIHVPGHTWGHVALWSEQERILIAGDAVQGSGAPYLGVPGQGTGLPYYLDAGAYRQSLGRLRALGAETLVVAHELPPANTRVISGANAVTEAIRASLLEADRLEEMILEGIPESRGATLAEIVGRVRSATKMKDLPPQAVLTVRGHLLELSARGMVTSSGGRWRLVDTRRPQ